MRNQFLLGLAGFFISCTLSMGVFAADQVTGGKTAITNYVEGTHYEKITPAQPTQLAPDKVEVVELFWYGCPHCFKFEPYVKKWLKNKPANVEFIRMPASLNARWKLHAGAYYVAELLNITDKVHEPLFNELNKNRGSLANPRALAEFFSKYGVDEEKFLKIYDSFAVRTRLNRDYSQAKRYGIRSVPTVIINGKYRTNATLAGGTNEDLIKVINYLVEKESSAAKEPK